MARLLSVFIFLIPLLTSNIVNADLAAADQSLQDGNFDAAAKEFMRLAKAGDARAQAHLGYMYYVGEGVPQNYEEAVKWYRKAAVQGDSDAQYNLAVAYAFAEGVEQDYKEAALWYRRAAEQGHAVAQYSLGISYSYGEGVDQSSDEAAKWFQRSAEQGYVRAQVLLGSKYHTGDGVQQNFDEAAKWYRKAADRGNAAAQYNLGSLYRSGKGVAQDYNQAIRWYRMAADQGYAAAQNELRSLERTITGIARKKSTPQVKPIPPQPKPAPAVTQQTEPSATEKPLLTVDKGSLLDLDDETSDEQTTIDSSVTETEEQIADTPASTTEETPEATAATTEKSGFFARLFGNKRSKSETTQTDPIATAIGSDAPATESESSFDPVEAEPITTETTESDPLLALDAIEPEVSDNESVDILLEDEPESTDSASEQTPAEEIATATEEEPRKRGFFSRLFGKKKQQETEEAEVALADSTITDTTDVMEPSTTDTEQGFDVADTVVVDESLLEEEAPGVVEEPTELTDESIEEPEKKKGFFSRLFGKKKQQETEEAEVALADSTETDTTDVVEPLTTDTEQSFDVADTVVVNESLLEEEASGVIDNTAAPLDETIEIDDETASRPKRMGFFSRLFGKNKVQTADSDASATTYGVNLEGETVADTGLAQAEVLEEPAYTTAPEQSTTIVEDETLAAAGTEETDTQTSESIYDVAEEIDTPVVETEKKKGFFSRLFGKKKQAETNETQVALADTTDTAEIQEDLTTTSEQNYEVSDTVVVDESLLEEDTPEVVEETAEEIDDTAETTEKKKGFFSRLFGKKKEENIETTATAETETLPAGYDDNNYEVVDTVVVDESLLQEETAKEEASVNEKEEKQSGFFGRLFGKDKSDTDETAVNEEQQDSEIATTEAEEEKPYIESIPADAEEMNAALTELQNGNYGDAFRSFRSMAGQGDAVAMYQVGSLYHQGLGTDQDHAEAARWYTRAAERGNADAQYSLGSMFLMGEGMEQDDKQAEYWYDKAASQGHDTARHNLSNLKKVTGGKRKQEVEAPEEDLLADSGSGGETIINEAAEASAAADAGVTAETNKKGFFKRIFSGDDEKSLDDTYESDDPEDEMPTPDPVNTESTATAPEEKKKKGFFSRIFGGDKEEESAEDEIQPGEIQITSQAPASPEFTAAVAELEQAFASRGGPSTESPESDYNNGLAYSLGDGVAQDQTKAFEYFSRAAERGHTDAQYKLGVAYAYGEGTQQDLQQAADWYRKAAVKGHITAQRNLGMMYLNGDGVSENKPLALAWYSILTDNGSLLDARRRDQLRAELNSSEIQEAERLQNEIQTSIQSSLN